MTDTGTNTTAAPQKSRRRLSLVAAYDAAKTTTNNERHWQPANYTSADLDANSAVRKTIRMKARYEFQNNSYCKGIVSTLVNDVIGTGVRLQVNDCPDETATAIERDFQAWYDAVCLTEKLKTGEYSRYVEGEGFFLLTTNGKVKNPVKLDIHLIDVDRVTSNDFTFDSRVVDGITLDEKGNVVSYQVYDQHPAEVILSEIKTIPAKYIIHIFNAERPGQHRGVSALAPCLELFGQLRDWTAATLTAAQTAACITAFIETDAPAGGEAEEIEPLEAIPLEMGQLMTLPAGWKFAPTKPEQPTSTYAAFKDELLAEISRCFNMPFNIAKCDSQNASYASSRLDTQIYFKTVKLEQEYLIHNCIERIFQAWLAEYTLNTKIKVPNFSYSFMFETGMVEHSDPSKLANSQKVQRENKTISLASIYAERGKNYEEELKQISYEDKLLLRQELELLAEKKKIMRELGLAPEDLTLYGGEKGGEVAPVVNEPGVDNEDGENGKSEE